MHAVLQRAGRILLVAPVANVAVRRHCFAAAGVLADRVEHHREGIERCSQVGKSTGWRRGEDIVTVEAAAELGSPGTAAERIEAAEERQRS